MNACMHVCISMVLCSASYSPVLLITLIITSHRFNSDRLYIPFLLFFSSSFFDCESFDLDPTESEYVCDFACFLLSFLVLFASLYVLLREFSISLAASRSAYTV